MALACLCCTLALGQAAWAESTTLEYKANGSGVSDETTKLTVSKLESDSNDYVVGAHLGIFSKSDYDAGDLSHPVVEWWTDQSSHQINKTLDAATTASEAPRYVLAEIDAPEGYVKADPVTFYLLSNSNFETTVVVESGDKTQNGAKNCEVKGEWSIALYDDETAEHRELEETRKRERTTQGSDSSSNQSSSQQTAERLAQTGDTFSLMPLVLIAAVGVAIIVIGIASWRGSKDGDGTQER